MDEDEDDENENSEEAPIKKKRGENGEVKNIK
jgi:hypothetical protein